MARWRRWIFASSVPLDEFARRFERSLAARGLAVKAGERFDLVVRGRGARAFVKLEFVDEGIAAVVKVKPILFAGTRALEDALLAAGRETEAMLHPR